MRAIVCSLIFSAWAAAAALPAVPTNSATALGAAACREQAGPAAVILAAVDRRGECITGMGTGFLIREDGVVVTARHVCEANAGLVAFTADGKRHRVTGFYGEDRDYDVAVVKLEGSGYAHLSFATAPLPQTNQWVAIVTPELHGQLLCVTGAVKTAVNVWDVIGEIAVTAPVHPGQSGSPLLDESGAVLGVVLGCNTNDGSGLAVPVTIVQRLLAQAGTTAPIPFAKRPRKGTSGRVIQDEMFIAGRRAYERHDWAGAEPPLKQVAKKYPDSPLALMSLGLTCTELHRWKEAEAAFARMVRLKPDSALAWYMYGLSSIMCGRSAKADAAMRRSIALGLTDKNQLPGAWTVIATAHAAQKDAKGAREALGNLQRLDPAQAEKLRRELQRNLPKLALSDDAGSK